MFEHYESVGMSENTTKKIGNALESVLDKDLPFPSNTATWVGRHSSVTKQIIKFVPGAFLGIGKSPHLPQVDNYYPCTHIYIHSKELLVTDKKAEFEICLPVDEQQQDKSCCASATHASI